MAPPKAPAKPQTVPEYIAAADQPARTRLREIRHAVRAAAPGAVESLKWGMPAHSYKRIVMVYAAFKHHVSIFPGAPALRAFKREVSQHDATGSTVRFPLDRPVPAALIRKLTAHRVQDCLEKDGKWRTKA